MDESILLGLQTICRIFTTIYPEPQLNISCMSIVQMALYQFYECHTVDPSIIKNTYPYSTYDIKNYSPTLRLIIVLVYAKPENSQQQIVLYQSELCWKG